MMSVRLIGVVTIMVMRLARLMAWVLLRMVLMTSLVLVIVRMTEMLFVFMFGDYVDTILLMMRMVMMWTMAII